VLPLGLDFSSGIPFFLGDQALLKYALNAGKQAAITPELISTEQNSMSSENRSFQTNTALAIDMFDRGVNVYGSLPQE